MENASKALIIAGAILLSILIISLGIMVYNNAQDTVGSASLDQQEIATFNAQFTPYIGQGISSSQVNSLIQQVLAVNQSEQNAASGIVVTMTFPSSDGSDGKIETATPTQITGDAMPTVSSGKTYDVTPTYTNSIITKIDVTPHGATTPEEPEDTP